MRLDEHDLRAGLRALTAAPPPAPPERARVSVRRRRRATVRRGLAIATAVAVAVPVVAFVAQRRERGAGVAATSVLRFPDRRDPAYRADAESAVDKSDPDHRPVRWLYAGRVPDTDLVAAVWAFCDETTCERLGIGWARGAAPRKWESTSVPMRGPELDRPLGYYFQGVDGTVLFAVGPTGARTLTYSIPGGGGGTIPVARGVFTANIGWVTARPQVRILDDTGRALYDGPLGLPDYDAVAYAPPLPPLRTVPPGYHLAATGVGQVGEHSGFGPAVPPNVRYRAFVRCVGTGSVFVYDEAGLEVVIPCDGRVHPGAPETRSGASADRIKVWNKGDPYATFAVAIGVR